MKGLSYVTVTAYALPALGLAAYAAPAAAAAACAAAAVLLHRLVNARKFDVYVDGS